MSDIPEFTWFILGGLGVTVQVTLLSILLTYVISFAAGFGYLSPYWFIRGPVIALTNVFRGVSVLVLMFWFYFALPLFGVSLSAMAAGVLALGLNQGAYGATIVRSAIQSIPVGQTEASIALNMTPFHRMWRIILPQAFRIMLPSFGNMQIQILKASANVSLITLADLTFQANSLRMTTQQSVQIFLILIVVYYLIALPLRGVITLAEKRLSKGRV